MRAPRDRFVAESQASRRRAISQGAQLGGGAILVDTPGLRELQLWEGDVDSAFSDIAELATQCKFNDCSHQAEPGCAVLKALTTGELDGDRADGPDARQTLEGEELGGAAEAELWVVARDLRGGQAVSGPYRVPIAR